VSSEPGTAIHPPSAIARDRLMQMVVGCTGRRTSDVMGWPVVEYLARLENPFGRIVVKSRGTVDGWWPGGSPGLAHYRC
jgi:hypothetical protein